MTRVTRCMQLEEGELNQEILFGFLFLFLFHVVDQGHAHIS